MKLWCEPCAANHVFSIGEVERIVYALVGSDLDSKSAQRIDEPEEWCLRDVLHASYDSEGYRAWVEVAISSRVRERRERSDAARRLLAGRAGPFVIALIVVAVVAAAVGRQLGSAPGPTLAALTPNSVGVIDPRHNAVVASVPVGIRPTRLAARADSVWVVNDGDSTVSRIDGSRARVTRTIATGGAAVAVGDGGVWALDDHGGLARIDPVGDTVSPVARLAVGKLRPDETPTLAVGAGRVWASAHGSVLGLATSRPDRIAAIVSDVVAQDVAVGRDVWVLTRSTYRGVSPALRVDRATGAILASVPIGLDPSAIALGEGSVWATAAGSATLFRIDPRSGEITAAIRVGEAPSDVAIGAGAVWVANSGDGTVSRVDPHLDRVVATIPLGERPDGIAVTAGRVWVSVY